MHSLVGRALGEAAEVSPFDRRVYQAFAAYCFEEPICHPSQQRVADDLGVCRESVNRAVRRLMAAGWMKIIDRRWSFRTGWKHNLYELLEPFAVSDLAMRRITRRGHNTVKKRARRIAARLRDGAPLGAGHTNPKGWCSCRWCRTDRTSIRRPPPPVRARSIVERGRERLWDRLQERGLEFEAIEAAVEQTYPLGAGPSAARGRRA